MKTYTKGNIIVEEIKLGDLIYEFGYGKFIQSEIITLPSKMEREDDNYWTWQSKNTLTNEIITYVVSDKYAHYGPELYNYPAYFGCEQI